MLYVCDLQGGVYVFQLFDYFGYSGASLLFIAVFESLAMGWVFGELQTRFRNNDFPFTHHVSETFKLINSVHKAIFFFKYNKQTS